MFTATGNVKLLVATYAAFFCLVCRAQFEHNAIQDCASSCGNIHNISYPFRLNTDPRHCGDKQYELACREDAVMLYLNVSGGDVEEYKVQAINYNNLTIRLADPNVFKDNCTLPDMSSVTEHYYNFRDSRFWPLFLSSHGEELNEILFLISCAYPMNGFEYNSPCNKVAANGSNSFSQVKRYWYFKIDNINSFDLESSCRVESVSLTSLLKEIPTDISSTDVRNSFAYGFDLSWERACCSTETSRKYDCSRALQNIFCGYIPDWYIKVKSIFSKILSFGNAYIAAVFDVVVFGILALFDLLAGKGIPNNYDYQTDGQVIYIPVAVLTVFAMYKGLSCFCGTPCVTIFLMYKWKRRHLSAYDNIEEFLHRHQNDLMPIRYSYSEVKKISRGFKEKLGKGGYGSVYKGKLRSGNFAAVKMLTKSKTNGQDFINEVATIGRIHHVNVVRLIGFCVEGSKRALIYEFMSNGSLDKHIFFKEGCIQMCNKIIYDICLGVAHGIQYLHQGCDMQILHFDIKPHNILLNENFIPKISDFGLAKLHSTNHSVVSLTAARGTIGYIAPEFFYKNLGGISYKADIYSFGMLLMEMVGRRKNLNAFTEHSSHIYFPSWIYDQFKEGKDIKLGDGGEEESNIVKKMIIVALWCIQLNPINRPSMCKVIEMLEGKVDHLKMPPKPFVAPQETPINDIGLHTNLDISPIDASNDYSNTVGLLIH